MSILLDTSVIIPALIAELPQHEKAAAVLRTAHRDGFHVSTHSIAELFSALTTLPVSPRITPGQAHALLDQNVLSKAEVVPLDAADYEEVITRMTRLGLSGGIVYDALHVRAAEKVGAAKLYTFNRRDFRRLPLAQPTELVLL